MKGFFLQKRLHFSFEVTTNFVCTKHKMFYSAFTSHWWGARHKRLHSHALHHLRQNFVLTSGRHLISTGGASKTFRMICEPFGTKNFKVSSPSKCTSAEISGSNLSKFGGCEFRQRLEARGKVCFFVTQTKETRFGSNAKVNMQCVRRREEILHVFADGRTSLCIFLAPHG